MRFLIVLLLVSFVAQAQTPPAKSYTEEEFIKKVSEEVQKKVEQIKNKSFTELTKELVDKEEKIKLRELELTKKEDQSKVNEKELEIYKIISNLIESIKHLLVMIFVLICTI